MQDLRTLWPNWGARPYSEPKDLAHSCFLALCLDLGQVLWHGQCHRWTCPKKAGVAQENVLGCIRWYLQGQRVGDAPVFDGVCARCGQLLYGNVNKGTATTGNKHLGAPCNVRDEACAARSQPPFLLRWPPKHLSKFLQDVFAWEEASNRLSLREQHRSSPPWKAKPHHRRADASEQWL